MGHREICQYRPQDDEYHIALELNPLGKRAQYQRWRDEREHALEHDKHQLGYACWHNGRSGNAIQKGLVKTTNYEEQRTARLLKARAERPRVTDGHPQYADNANDKHRLHDDAQHVFLSYQTAIEQGDARNRHKQHQRRGHNHPRRVTTIKHRLGGTYHVSRQRTLREQSHQGSRRGQPLTYYIYMFMCTHCFILQIFVTFYHLNVHLLPLFLLFRVI